MEDKQQQDGDKQSRCLDRGVLNTIAQSVHVACINQLASATPETCSLPYVACIHQLAS